MSRRDGFVEDAIEFYDKFRPISEITPVVDPEEGTDRARFIVDIEGP